MEVIRARNVHEALPEALHRLTYLGVDRPSRNGPVRMFKEPVTTVYERPTERVIFWPERDANPFFHLMECLWIVAGRDDLSFLTKFNSKIASFSDNGLTLHGAYGYRLRSWFHGRDQLVAAQRLLLNDRDTRRVVLQLWDAESDLGNTGKDLPCNTEVNVGISHDGKLDIKVNNRSNDLVWGAYGANAVHFSFLQEYLAAFIGVPVGRYWQDSFNLHAYHSTLQQVEMLADRAGPHTYIDNPYALCDVEPYPIVSTDYVTWHQDLMILMDRGPIVGFREPFFRQVVTPMWHAHEAWKQGKGLQRYDAALEIIEQCRASDWRLAATEWLQRRRAKHIEKESKS